MNQPEAKIIIIGAGAAGLGAANYLYRQNFKQLMVLEASDRIGGRVHTVHFGAQPDCVIELGANWIHGSNPANPLYTLAADRGFLTSNQPPKLLNRRVGYTYTSDGRIIDKDISIKVWDLYIETEAQSAGEGFRGSVKEYMDSKLNKVLDEFSSDDRRDAALVYNSTMFNYMSFHIGDELDKIGVHQSDAYVEIPGGDITLPKGYSHLLNSLTRNLPLDLIRFKHKVTQIDWQDNTPLKLTCADGGEFQPDHVIITVSLGYLKKHHLSLFSPQLPTIKRMAIEKLGFGRVDKLFLQFERPFWAGDFGSIRMAWTEDEMKCEDWTRYIFGFEPVVDNPNVLVGWVSGDGAQLMEALSHDAIRDDCVRILRRFSGNPLIPEPCRVVVSKWCSDELIGGSYSYLPIDCERECLSHLGCCLPTSEQPRLLFAGEATHLCYFSTVHGALLSGFRAAQQIVDFFK